MDCREAIDDLMALTQGELGMPRAAGVRDHLSSCPSCREEEKRIVRTLETTRLVRLDAIDLPLDLFARISERIDEKPSVPPPFPVFPAAPRAARLPWVAAAALLLSCAAALTLFLGPIEKTDSPPESARLAYVRGDAFAIVAGGELEAVKAGEPLPLGTELRAEGLARIDLPGGIRLGLEKGAVRVRDGDVVQLSGGLAVSVTERRPFSVVTPHASVHVKGTRFFLGVGPEGTAVQVEKGSVEVSNPSGTLTLAPGDAAMVDRITPPRRAGRGVTPAWSHLLSSETLFLDLLQPETSRPRILEFRITNVSPRPLFLPHFDPDRPHFSLCLRSGRSGEEGVVNLAPFLLSGASPPAESHRPSLHLAPGETVSLKFDVSPLLWMAGSFEVSGVYQAPRGCGSRLWVGQVESQKRTIEVREDR